MQKNRKEKIEFIIIMITAMVVCIANGILLFDNVLWGDEAYAANITRVSYADIFEILHYNENHPPLYYLWLKFMADLFGGKGVVFHLASYIPFMLGILLAITQFRKKFGFVPTMIFILTTGLAGPCIEYNIEVRMYSIAYLGVILCFYSVYMMFAAKKGAMLGVILGGFMAGYSHYWALVTAGILLFFAGIGMIILYGKKKIKVVLIVWFGFVLGYLPWIPEVLAQFGHVSGNWWMTEVVALPYSLVMVVCGKNMGCALLIIGSITLGHMMFSVVKNKPWKKDPVTESVETLDDTNYLASTPEFMACLAGGGTIVGVLVVSYGMCLLMGPIIATRYFYPLSAIFLMMVVISTYKFLGRDKINPKVMVVMYFMLVFMFCIGIFNYQKFAKAFYQEELETKRTMELIGNVSDDVVFVNNAAEHLGWSVLQYYYPNNQILNEGLRNIRGENVWLLSGYFLLEEEIEDMESNGYQVECLEGGQLAKYRFILYRLTLK